MISAKQLADSCKCQLGRAEKWLDHINRCLDYWEINTPLRQAHFLAQVAHESGRLATVEENLNYSAAALQITFKKYFNSTNAVLYARKPEKIANLVYANRMGNGSENSGEGWKYRGKGLIQITGKDNHFACGQALGVDLISHPEMLLVSLELAAMSAGWFWAEHGCNELADNQDVLAITKKINGGTNGLDDRKLLLDGARKALKC